MMRWVFAAVGLACVATEVWGVHEFLTALEGGITYIVVAGCLVAGAAPLCPGAARVLWNQGRPGGAAAAWLVFGLCLATVLTAAISRTGTASDAAERLRDQAARAEKLAQDDVVDAVNALNRATGEADRECATGRGTACRDAEAKADKLRGDLAAARQRLAAAPTAQVDPLAARIAALTPLTVDEVQLIQPLILPLALFGLGTVFLTAAAAPAVAVASGIAPAKQEPRQRQPPEPVAVKAAEPAQLVQMPGSVSRFMLEFLEPRDGGAVDMADILRTYRSWCQDTGVPALERPALIRELKRLVDAAALETREDGNRVLCVDVAWKPGKSVRGS